MPYDAWKADPTPDNLAKVVDSLQPVMNYQLGSLGVSDDPLIKNKARIVAAQAVRKYDPKLATLPTFVSRQLQQLRRFRRQSHQVLKVPERIQMDGWHLAQKEKEFLDKHDREPDLYELADFSKLPVGRIAKIRRLSRATPSEAAIGDTAADDMDFTGEALEYVFRDSDHLDRRILEMKTGYGGHQVMTPAQIAQKLRISTAQVSRRAARLTMKVNQLQQDMQDINR
jgi:DNA-directed RNA polymerase specialized sigma subunit